MQLSKTKKYAMGLGATVLGILLILVLVIIPLQTSPPPWPPPPSPNGYEDFVKAGEMLQGDYSQYKTMKPEELGTALATDQEAITRAQLGLDRECRVPLEQPGGMAEIAAYTGRHMPELAAIKAVSQMLMARGSLADFSNQPDEAVSIYLDVIRLGHEVRRGGLLIDLLLGIACESMGLNALAGLAPRLDASQSRNLARTLEVIDAKQEPAKVILEREHVWSRRAGGWRLALVRLIRPGLTKEAEQKALQKARRTDTQRRRLMLDAAIRAYELEEGTKPDSVSKLVPGYLTKIPNHPETGRPMD